MSWKRPKKGHDFKEDLLMLILNRSQSNVHLCAHLNFVIVLFDLEYTLQILYCKLQFHIIYDYLTFFLSLSAFWFDRIMILK